MEVNATMTIYIYPLMSWTLHGPGLAVCKQPMQYQQQKSEKPLKAMS